MEKWRLLFSNTYISQAISGTRQKWIVLRYFEEDRTSPAQYCSFTDWSLLVMGWLLVSTCTAV